MQFRLPYSPATVKTGPERLYFVVAPYLISLAGPFPPATWPSTPAPPAIARPTHRNRSGCR